MSLSFKNQNGKHQVFIGNDQSAEAVSAVVHLCGVTEAGPAQEIARDIIGDMSQKQKVTYEFPNGTYDITKQ